MWCHPSVCLACKQENTEPKPQGSLKGMLPNFLTKARFAVLKHSNRNFWRVFPWSFGGEETSLLLFWWEGTVGRGRWAGPRSVLRDDGRYVGGGDGFLFLIYLLHFHCTYTFNDCKDKTITRSSVSLFFTVEIVETKNTRRNVEGMGWSTDTLHCSTSRVRGTGGSSAVEIINYLEKSCHSESSWINSPPCASEVVAINPNRLGWVVLVSNLLYYWTHISYLHVFWSSLTCNSNFLVGKLEILGSHSNSTDWRCKVHLLGLVLGCGV